LLLHVSTPDADREGEENRTDVSRRGVASQMRRSHRELEIVSMECSKLGVDATALLVRGTSPRGNPVPKLLKEVARRRPDLIVMGTHGHGRLHEALLGSASAAVLRKAACPVLLIPSRATKPVWPERSDERRLPRTKAPLTRELKKASSAHKKDIPYSPPSPRFV
jgi:hypothetical protein